MPYDGTNYPTDVRNLLTLADALERGYPDFEWFFGDILNECGTAGCAVGLAIKMGLIPHTDDEGGLEVRDAFGLSINQAYTTFGYAALAHYGVESMCDVEPHMVATRLREIAAEKMKVS